VPEEGASDETAAQKPVRTTPRKRIVRQPGLENDPRADLKASKTRTILKNKKV